MYTALGRPFVGLSDGRVYDPRNGCALDWWGTGAPTIQQDADMPDYWSLEFPDGTIVLCTRKGIYVLWDPMTGQVRVEVPFQTRSLPRRLRREQLGGRRPVAGTPLFLSQARDPQEWPPPEPRKPYPNRGQFVPTIRHY